MIWTWLIFGALFGALAAQKKGMSIVVGVLAGIFLGLFAPLMFFLTPVRKPCPTCAEMVQFKARLCPHCRTELAPP